MIKQKLTAYLEEMIEILEKIENLDTVQEEAHAHKGALWRNVSFTRTTLRLKVTLMMMESGVLITAIGLMCAYIFFGLIGVVLPWIFMMVMCSAFACIILFIFFGKVTLFFLKKYML